MVTSIIFLTIAALLPVAASIGFFFLDKFTGFKNLKYWPKQAIYGVVFGGLAVVGTHWGIPFSGAAANARDASVLIGGFIFGGPAGVIAGTIGGLERMIVGLVNPTKYGFTVVACSVSTFLAGVIAALIRHYAFEENRPRVVSGFFAGFVVEVFHLLMVFVTNANQYQKAFNVVKACTPPMLIANSLAVLVALIVANVLEKGKKAFEKPDPKSLNNRVIITLSGLTVIAFVLSTLFVYFFDDRMSSKTLDNNLSYAITETAEEVSYKTVEKAYFVKGVLDRQPTLEAYKDSGDMCDRLNQFALDQQISEINLVHNDGHILYSSVREYAENEFWMNDPSEDYNQSREFHNNIMNPEGPGYYIQNFRKPVNLEAEERKYAGVQFEYDFDHDGTKELGYIQVGYNEAGVDSLVENIANYKSVGNTGALVVLDSVHDEELLNFFPNKIVSKGNDVELESNVVDSLKKSIINNPQDVTYKFSANGVNYFARYRLEDTHFIVSLMPVEEGMLSRNISIFVNTFLEIIVFGLVFLTVYILIKRLVLNRIDSTNEALGKITAGDLEVVLDGGNVTEFKVLSDDINKTVDALKKYIDDANKRIDEELAMAKAIQTAVLPSAFPAFPDRKEFDVHASMHAAKEVGGDFYDFYFSNSDTFHITIADVSGKGIPAALFMMRAKSVLKSLAQTNMPINEVFMKGNDSLCTGNEAGMFVTAWSATIDLNTGVMRYANGGHNPPLLKRANGKFEYIKSRVNLVLAAMSGMPYGMNEIKLEPGDTIYLYTDGVTEGVNQQVEQFGEPRLLETLNEKQFKSCKDICDHVFEECIAFADGAAQFDDITMLAFTYKGK